MTSTSFSRLLLPGAVAALAVACSPAVETNNQKPVVTDVSLDPPAAGQGFQLAPAEFEVPPGTDMQRCYFYRIPGEGTDPVLVNKFVVAQTGGTHHMNIFRVKTIYGLDPANGDQVALNGQGPCFDSGNWADWPLVVNSQEGGNMEWVLPEGVVHRFQPGEWIMLQSHYVNTSIQQTPAKGKVLVNFHSIPSANVNHELGSLFATKQSIRICQSDARSKFSGTCHFNSTEPVHIVGANGHFHSRGRRFEMYSWDGTSVSQPPDSDRFYVSEEWQDPVMARSPELDVVIPPGGGIYYTCEFEWVPPPPEMGCDGLNREDQRELGTPEEAFDCCYTFGGPVDWAEHCNSFLYFFPKSDNVICY